MKFVALLFIASAACGGSTEAPGEDAGRANTCVVDETPHVCSDQQIWYYDVDDASMPHTCLDRGCSRGATCFVPALGKDGVCQ